MDNLRGLKQYPHNRGRKQAFDRACRASFAPYKARVCEVGKARTDYRRQALPLSCSQAKPTWSAFNFIADERRRVMVCMPPKTGCTEV